MSHNSLLARGQQLTYLRSSSTNTCDYASSPSVEPPAWAPQSLLTSPTLAYSDPPLLQSATRSNTQSSDLFSTLLFNREAAYRGSVPVLPEAKAEHRHSTRHGTCDDTNSQYSTVSPILEPTNAHNIFLALVTGEDLSFSGDMNPASHTKERQQYKTAVSKETGKLPAKKKPSTKSTGKAVKTLPKTRATTKSQDGQEKFSKKIKPDPGIIERVRLKDPDNTPEKAAPWGIIEMSVSDHDTESSDPKMTAAVPSKQEESEELPQTWNSGEKLSPGGPTNAVSDEVQRLRKELEAARDTSKSLQARLDQIRASARSEQEKMRTKYEHNIAKPTKDLHSEEKRASEPSRAQLHLHQGDAEKYTKLQTEYGLLRTQRDHTLSTHAEVLEEMLKESERTKSHVSMLQASNERLAKENQTLKSAAMNTVPNFVPRPSPAPSSALSFSSDEERKEENLRRMYVKTKRQFDDLTAATKDVLNCTRNMDLSCFGDFGRCVKRMKAAVEMEDGCS